MEARSEKLDVLPVKGNEYWEHSDYELNEPKERKCKGHVFIHKTAQDVECKFCHIGFQLSPGWNVKNGKIYLGDKFVI